MRRQREVVDRKPVVGARNVYVLPPDPERGACWDRDGERRAHCRAIRAEIAVERSDGASRDRRGEIERVDVDPRARRGRRIRRVEAVLKMEPIGNGPVRRHGTEAPLLAGVADGDRSDRRA